MLFVKVPSGKLRWADYGTKRFNISNLGKVSFSGFFFVRFFFRQGEISLNAGFFFTKKKIDDYCIGLERFEVEKSRF